MRLFYRFKHCWRVDSRQSVRLFSLTSTDKLFSNSICGVTAGEPWSSEGSSHWRCPPPASGAPCGRDWYRHADRESWQTCWGGGGGGGWVRIQLEWVLILYFQREQLHSVFCYIFVNGKVDLKVACHKQKTGIIFSLKFVLISIKGDRVQLDF